MWYDATHFFQSTSCGRCPWRYGACHAEFCHSFDPEYYVVHCWKAFPPPLWTQHAMGITWACLSRKYHGIFGRWCQSGFDFSSWKESGCEVACHAILRSCITCERPCSAISFWQSQRMLLDLHSRSWTRAMNSASLRYKQQHGAFRRKAHSRSATLVWHYHDQLHIVCHIYIYIFIYIRIHIMHCLLAIYHMILHHIC